MAVSQNGEYRICPKMAIDYIREKPVRILWIAGRPCQTNPNRQFLTSGVQVFAVVFSWSIPLPRCYAVQQAPNARGHAGRSRPIAQLWLSQTGAIKSAATDMMLYIPDVHRFAVAIHCLKDTNSLKPKMTIVTQWAHQLPLRFSGLIQSFFWDNVTTPLLCDIFSKKRAWNYVSCSWHKNRTWNCLASLYISLAVPSGKSTILFDDCPNVVFPCLSSLSMVQTCSNILQVWRPYFPLYPIIISLTIFQLDINIT